MDDNKEFKLDLTENLSDRMDAFERALLNLENTIYRHLFDENNRLWDHYNFHTVTDALITKVGFGFKGTSNLDVTVRENLFKLFRKHFPDGVETSLTGYPQNP